MIKITDWADTQKPILHELFDTAWDGESTSYDKCCKVEESSDAYEVDLQMQSPDEIAESTEGGMYTRVEVENIRKQTYIHSLFKGEIKITQEMIEDGKYRLIYNGVKHLARAAARTVERRVAQALYNAFSSTTSPDGQPVFASHTLANPLAGRPTTFANNFTGKLTAPNLKTMRIAGRKTLDEHGSISPRKYKKLIVPSALEYAADQLMAPASAGEPGTANNDQNVAGKGMQVVVNDWLEEAPTNADTTFYLQDPDEHQFMFFWRVKPQQNKVIEESSGDLLYRVRMRFSVGYSDYRGMAASIGTTP